MPPAADGRSAAATVAVMPVLSSSRMVSRSRWSSRPATLGLAAVALVVAASFAAATRVLAQAPGPSSTSIAATDPAGAPAGGQPTTSLVRPSSTVNAPTTTIKPEQCDPFAPLTVTFVGRVTVRDQQVVQFTVVSTKDPQISVGETLAVVYPRDARFLKIGESYSVAATTDPQSLLLLSKVRPKKDEDPRCSAKDPITTRRPDGSHIETGILSGMHGKWRHALLLIGLPLGVVLFGLTVLVLLKHTIGFTVRSLRRRGAS
jgi:hypothetical protein